MTWTVLSDFDHTITTEDVTDVLLERYALPEWQTIEQEWKKGNIGSRACMERQIALLRATKEQVDAVADSIHVDPYFREFAAHCGQHHVRLFVVSDGLDYVIKRVLTRQGFGNLPVFASHLAYKGDDRWELTSPYANAGCDSLQSTCKCKTSQRIRAVTGADNILYIGDGRSDFCVSAQEADLVLAKDSLLTYCVQNQLPHRPFKHFAEATQILDQLIDRDRQKPLIHTEEALYA